MKDKKPNTDIDIKKLLKEMPKAEAFMGNPTKKMSRNDLLRALTWIHLRSQAEAQELRKRIEIMTKEQEKKPKKKK